MPPTNPMRQNGTEVSQVTFVLNGREVVGRADRTILENAQRFGVEVPRLCHMPGMRPDGNCRTCMVEIEGERVLAPSCCRYPTDGMVIATDSPRAILSHKVSIELLLAEILSSVGVGFRPSALTG